MRLTLLITFMISCLRLSAQTEQELLNTLDKVIENKWEYRQERQSTIDSLMNMSKYVLGARLLDVYNDLYVQYAHYQSDSAMIYLNRILDMPAVKSDYVKSTQYLLLKTETYAIMGQYSEAAGIIESLNVDNAPNDIKTNFYHAARTLYGWKADYMKHAIISSNTCRAKTQLYRDSIIMCDREDTRRLIALADNYICMGKPDSAITILNGNLEKATGKQKAYLYFNLSEAYKQKNDIGNQLKYLALTAIYDIQRGVTEYAALPMLAKLLNDRGDTERAYNYMFCSLEDANFCNARLRTIEVSEMFPIIDKSHKNQLTTQKHVYLTFSIVLAVISILLVTCIFFFRREMRKLSATRQQLSLANDELTKRNIALNETNKVKEEYITLYLNRCRGNIDSFDNYRRTLLRLAMSAKHDELLKQLKSAEPFKQEQKKFYDDFDEAFLGIHPDFIDNFNALLTPECRITPKKNEHLSPELRIYALVRLGITDISEIAHFLDYSMPTIYNYRSKIYNSAIVPKEEFNDAVMRLP